MTGKPKYNPEADEPEFTSRQMQAIESLERSLARCARNGVGVFVWSGNPCVFQESEYDEFASNKDWWHRRVLRIDGGGCSMDGGDPG